MCDSISAQRGSRSECSTFVLYWRETVDGTSAVSRCLRRRDWPKWSLYIALTETADNLFYGQSWY